MPDFPFPIRETEGFRFLDEGPASDLPPVVLLHGMLGDLSNWTQTVRTLAENQYRTLVPVLPVYGLPIKQTSVRGLVEYVHRFLQACGIDEAVLVGNSLGGHVALLYALEYPTQVTALILSGASGIYEVGMGTTIPRRQDRSFIRERAAVTFYDPCHVTDELVDEMFEIVNDRTRAARLIMMARSTQQETVIQRLGEIHMPTLLVWGRNDSITPPDVGQTFAERLPNARLHLIDRCGHAPMIEHPDAFNLLMLDFLREEIGDPLLASSPASTTPEPRRA